MDHSVPSLIVTTSAPGIGRRSLISAGLLGLLTACGSTTGGSADGRTVRTVPAPDPDVAVRLRAIRTIGLLAADYDGALAAFPDLGTRLTPLRAQLQTQLTAFRMPGPALSAPDPSPSAARPHPLDPTAPTAAPATRGAALATLGAAAGGTVPALLTDLATASPALARQLASASACAAQQTAALHGSVPAAPAPVPVPTASLPAAPLPAPALAALQAALAAEDAAVYAYGVVGAQLSGPSRTRATGSYQAHRARRGALQQRIAASGAVPAAAAPAYRLPAAVTDPASAVRLAGLVEDRICAVYANAVQATTGPLRATAAAALRQSALDCYAWRGTGSAFPGLPDD